MSSSPFVPTKDQENLSGPAANASAKTDHVRPKHDALPTESLAGVARALPMTRRALRRAEPPAPGIETVEVDDKMSLVDEAVKMLLDEAGPAGHWAKYKWPTDEEAVAVFYAARQIHGY